MRTLLLIPVLLLALVSCSNLSRPDPAIAGVAELRSMFLTEQKHTLQLVENSNPTPAMLERFQQAQADVRRGFEAVYEAVQQNLASIGSYSPEEFEAVLNKALEIREQLR